MRRILLAVMSTFAAVGALFGYRTSSAHPAAAVATTVATSADGSAEASPSAVPSTPTSSAPSSSRSVAGQSVQTRWGPVQVQITASGKKVTAVDVVQVPDGNPRDVEINDYAVPVLTQETLQAQSADIDGVSGATVTSNGYVTSLQSALDKAGL